MLLMVLSDFNPISFIGHKDNKTIVYADFESSISAFPESYKTYLRQLHKEHANWTFTPLKTGIDFDEIIPSIIDHNSLISFEFVLKNKSLLNENTESRGKNCTSIDALVYAKKGNDKWLIPIEWKYTEAYLHDNKVYNFNDLIITQGGSIIQQVSPLIGHLQRRHLIDIQPVAHRPTQYRVAHSRTIEDSYLGFVDYHCHNSLDNYRVYSILKKLRVQS